jgi:hypothetical protein
VPSLPKGNCGIRSSRDLGRIYEGRKFELPLTEPLNNHERLPANLNTVRGRHDHHQPNVPGSYLGQPTLIVDQTSNADETTLQGDKRSIQRAEQIERSAAKAAINIVT